MVVRPCRECKASISTAARVYPQCGANRPTRSSSSVGRRLFLLALFTVVVLGSVGIYGAYRSDEEWLAAHPGQTPPDPTTGRPPLDHTKPWFSVQGWPLCPTKADLAALRENLANEAAHLLKERRPTGCIAAKDGWHLVEVDQDGSFDPDYLVRVTDLPGRPSLWIPNRGVRN